MGAHGVSAQEPTVGALMWTFYGYQVQEQKLGA